MIVGSRDPNDMHTPERCFIGSGFELGNVERREIKVTQPEPKTYLFNLMTVKSPDAQEMVLYGYDGVQMLGSSTMMARSHDETARTFRETRLFCSPLDPTGRSCCGGKAAHGIRPESDERADSVGAERRSETVVGRDF